MELVNTGHQDKTTRQLQSTNPAEGEGTVSHLDKGIDLKAFLAKTVQRDLLSHKELYDGIYILHPFKSTM
jgi:hypothetical protein